MKKILIIFMVITSLSVFSQVGIGTQNPHPSAYLDVDVSTLPEDGKKGFLPPRITTSQRDAIDSPAAGLIVYNTDDNCIQVNNGTLATPNWVCLGIVTPYQNIRGKVTTVQATTYTVQPDDHLIVTNHNAQVTITFPTLTNTAADIGRVVHVHNNNIVTGSTLYSGTVIGNTVTNQFRGRTLIWTGTAWVIIGL